MPVSIVGPLIPSEVHLNGDRKGVTEILMLVNKLLRNVPLRKCALKKMILKDADSISR